MKESYTSKKRVRKTFGKIDAVADSAIGGEIIVLLGEPRYAVETEQAETTETEE